MKELVVFVVACFKGNWSKQCQQFPNRAPPTPILCSTGGPWPTWSIVLQRDFGIQAIMGRCQNADI